MSAKSHLEDNWWKSASLEEIERQVSPSFWPANCHQTREDTINDFVSTGFKETKLARKNLQHLLDVSYGELPLNKYDVYGTNLSDDAATFVFIHGGYWQECTKDMSAYMARTFCDAGIRTIVLDYTLAPAGTIPQMEREVYAAILKITSDYPTSPIIVGGHSAGAHLASSLFKFSSLHNKLKGYVLISGVFDLRPLISSSINQPLKLTISDAESLSPLLVHKDLNLSLSLRILLLVGECESPEFHRESTSYHNLLKSKKSSAELFICPNEDHFTVISNLVQGKENQQLSKKVIEFVYSASR